MLAVDSLGGGHDYQIYCYFIRDGASKQSKAPCESDLSYLHAVRLMGLKLSCVAAECANLLNKRGDLPRDNQGSASGSRFFPGKRSSCD